MDQTKTMPPRRHYLWVAAIGIALAGAGAWYGTQGRRPGLKNVILISIDTLRADHLSYAGYQRPTSPAIDRLAAQSLDFRRAYSQAPETLPSHASMFSSMYPSVHKAHVDTGLPLADGFTTLAERFRDNGFRTGAFVGGAQLSALWNLDQGFETYDASTLYERDEICPDDLEEILAKAERWIELHRQEPFFCFVHSYVVHEPWTPPAGYDRMFDEAYQGPLPFRMGLGDWWELNKTYSRPDDPDVRHVVSLYDGEIRYMDDHLGRFLDKLTHLGLDHRTVVVFTSDHGEEFAERGVVGRHGHTLADELLHVPLLIRVPGIKPRVVERQVRLIDLAPTLLALMNIDPGAEPLQGQNLLAHGHASGPHLPVLSERTSPAGLWVSLRYPDRKVIGLEGRTFLLHDLVSDPAEQQDIFDWDRPDHRDLVKDIQARMADNKDFRTHSAVPVELDPETEAQMRALGYIE